jgi:hypothetical protein
MRVHAGPQGARCQAQKFFWLISKSGLRSVDRMTSGRHIGTSMPIYKFKKSHFNPISRPLLLLFCLLEW